MHVPPASVSATTPLIDGFGRQVNYARFSVTDRCDFRCVYCMSERMTFLPRARVLTLEELAVLGRTFVELGVRKIRVTGANRWCGAMSCGCFRNWAGCANAD